MQYHLPFKFPLFIILAVPLIIISACNSEVEPELGRLEVRLHDAPLDDVDAVNVYIDRVEINESASENGWKIINNLDQSYDLLSLTNGVYEIIGDTLIEPGTYEQIRLILHEDGHNLVIDDEIHDLVIPSSSLTGVKLNIHTQIEAGNEYVVLLDFDVSKSVFETGTPQTGFHYILVPVIRANILAESGLISGSIFPIEAEPIIYAIQNTDTLASTFADTLNGEFQLPGLNEGIYRVAIEPRSASYISRDVNDVEVVIGKETDLGEIELTELNF